MAQGNIVFTAPDADGSCGVTRRAIGRVVSHRSGRNRVESFGSLNDPAMLREVAVVGGNSLSGLLETPALRVPTITIGARQAGRTRGAHVVDAEASADALGQRLGKVLDPAFREGLEGRKNPHGGRAAERVVNVLKNASRDRNLIVKRFHDGGAR